MIGKKTKYTLEKGLHRSRKIPFVMAITGLVGSILLYNTLAAGTFVLIQTELASIHDGVTIQKSANASKGSYLDLGRKAPVAITDSSPVGVNGQLNVCGLQLCNQFDNPIQLRGMSTHGIQWYGNGQLAEVECINDSSLDSLKNDWQADALRVSLYVQEGGYETNPEGFTAMAETIIDKVIERGMYVLIDWHQLNPGDPNDNLEAAKTYFTHMAQRYKDKPNVIYEVANEPNSENSSVDWNRVKQYHDVMVPLIRAIDPDNIIILGTPGWDTFGNSDGADMSDVWNNPVQGTNLMYTWHMYTASHTSTNFLEEAATRLPVFVTEWGTQTSSGDGGNNFATAQQYIDLMATKKISWTSWNYSDDFRSGAVFRPGTCPNGPWTGGNLKEAGTWIQDKMKSPADNFPTT